MNVLDHLEALGAKAMSSLCIKALVVAVLVLTGTRVAHADTVWLDCVSTRHSDKKLEEETVTLDIKNNRAGFYDRKKQIVNWIEEPARVTPDIVSFTWLYRNELRNCSFFDRIDITIDRRSLTITQKSISESKCKSDETRDVDAYDGTCKVVQPKPQNSPRF